MKHKPTPSIRPKRKAPVKPFGNPPSDAVLVHRESDGSSAVYWVPVAERPDHPAFKPVRFPADTEERDEIIEGTSYIADYATNEVRCFLTVIPEHGMKVAWDMCSNCHAHFTRCRCEELTPPNYIINWRRIQPGDEYQQPGKLVKADLSKGNAAGKPRLRKELHK